MEGVEKYECRNVDRLKRSIEAGHGILLTPNHCRTADPLVLGWLAYETRCLMYAMASWHLFNSGWFNSWAIRMLGAFSVNREGLDRESIQAAIKIIERGDRPLVVFAEGTTSRTNDLLMELMEGVGFIAKSAARKRAKKSGGKVVVHPVAIKYFYEGDLQETVIPVLEEIERRLTWKSRSDRSLMMRVRDVGTALLSLKELEYFGEVQKGEIHQRQDRLISRLLDPLEERWLGGSKEGGVVPRIKAIRMQIYPDLARGDLAKEEQDRRWSDLHDTYLAQQVACYPKDYLEAYPSVDRILETVERFEEDLIDHARLHGKLKVVIDVCEAIEVSPEREKKGESDPLMQEIRTRLQARLDEFAKESPLFSE